MPRYVILRHETGPASAGPSHWDLMFESAGVLRTWSSTELPDDTLRPARALADHRLAYLQYEGPVSGQRGTVRRWDEGTYIALQQTADQWVLELAGTKLAGLLTLVRSSGDEDRWAIRFQPESEILEGPTTADPD